MLRFYSILLASSAIALLSSCATTRHGSAENELQTREQRSLELAEITAWKISGALAIREPGDAWSATVNWLQNGNKNYVLKLLAPAGMGTVKVVGNPTTVTLTDSNKQTFTAPTGEVLLEQQTGWYIPVSNRFYWIRGVEVPGLPANKKLDKYKHLASLSQQGWTIDYLRFTNVNGVDLPSKLSLSYQNLQIKLIIKRWEIPKLPQTSSLTKVTP